ncbi:hypothetical protein Taro_003014 [Colocasia esculenta]|uniref:Uncharacterized protein n=1 Tax=Colocasia esculenta TaxID=4460 RepID=A0A843TMH1_COLES|nr:hypothetical protein [Colocasia esculenta]
MKSISHGLGFDKQKSKKDKSGEKKDKAPLIKFVKGPSLENTEIKQTSSKTPKSPKTQKQSKSTRSTQSPDRSTPVHKKKDSVAVVSTPVKERSTLLHLVSTHFHSGRHSPPLVSTLTPLPESFFAVGAGRPDGRLLSGIRQVLNPSPSTSSLLHSIPVRLLSFLTLHPLLFHSMAPKQAPRRGAKSRATARPIPEDDDPPERRTKRRHDPAEQPGPSSNSQADVFNTKETLSQISKTRLSFAHLVDDLESMKNLFAHIDEEMSTLKKEFKVLNRPAWSAGTNIYCKDGVDTPHTGVDTMFQDLRQKVDTREPSQKAYFTVWDMVSTLDHLRSTLETSPRELICQSGTVCRHTSWAGRHTPESL